MERTREIDFPLSARHFMTGRAALGLALLILLPIPHSILGSEPPSTTEIAVPGEDTLQGPVLTDTDPMAVPQLDGTETQTVLEQLDNVPDSDPQSEFNLFVLLYELELMFLLLDEEWSLDHAIADDCDVLIGIFVGIGASVEPPLLQIPVVLPE